MDDKGRTIKTASQKINEGVTFVMYDALNAKVEDLLHNIRKLDTKTSQIDLFSKRLQHMEFNLQKFEQKADEKVKTQDQSLATFDETI